MSLASNLTLGDSNFNIVEKISEQIFKMVKDIIDKKSDDIVYNIIGPQIEENMKTIFESYPVKMEASKMFNREIFPMYKRTLEDFANFNSLVKEANQEIEKVIEEYANVVIANKDNADKKNEAKQKLMTALKSVSESKVGDVLSMKGGDLQAFLGDEENKFKPVEGGTPAPPYMEGETNKIDKALEQIAGGMKENYDENKTHIQENIEANEKFNEEMRKKQGLADLGNKLKMGGGKSKRRKHRKRSKTYKKRR